MSSLALDPHPDTEPVLSQFLSVLDYTEILKITFLVSPLRTSSIDYPSSRHSLDIYGSPCNMQHTHTYSNFTNMFSLLQI